MSNKEVTRLVHVGEFVAEVPVTQLVTDDAWSPFLSVEDAKKLDAVRVALKRQDLRGASRYARVFRLTPVTV